MRIYMSTQSAENIAKATPPTPAPVQPPQHFLAAAQALSATAPAAAAADEDLGIPDDSWADLTPPPPDRPVE